MSLTLYLHPLSSYCQKALVALYENETPFTPQLVDLRDEKERAEFLKIWPVGKFPVLRDTARNVLVPESSVIIEYLQAHYPGRSNFIPADPDLALRARQWDRFYDFYVNDRLTKVITDRLRPEGKNDPHGVEEAAKLLRTAMGMVDKEMANKTWAVGDVFTLADCAAAPALFYGNMVVPLRDAHKNAAAYLDRLMQRPSYARALKEAQPYLNMVPKET